METKDYIEQAKGKFLNPFDHRRYVDERMGPAFSKGICSALSTMWVIKTAKGNEFFRYLESAQAREDLAQLQSNDDNIPPEFLQPLTPWEKFADAVADKTGVSVAPARAQRRAAKREFNKQRQADRVTAIEDRTGLSGTLQILHELPEAVREATEQEGYVTFGFANAQGQGHEIAMYCSMTHGYRIFDANWGEAYFAPKKRKEFKRFLKALTRNYGDDGESGVARITLRTYKSSRAPLRPSEDCREDGGTYTDLDNGKSFAEIMEPKGRTAVPAATAADTSTATATTAAAADTSTSSTSTSAI